WREDQVLAARERLVDRLCVIGRPGNEELVDWYRRAGGRPVAPRRARRVVAERRNEHVVATRRIEVQERPLPGQRTRRQRRVRRRVVRRRGERLRRRADDAREDLIPDTVGPAADAAVPHEELLLRPVDDEAGLRVGDEAAARGLR